MRDYFKLSFPRTDFSLLEGTRTGADSTPPLPMIFQSAFQRRKLLFVPSPFLSNRSPVVFSPNSHHKQAIFLTPFLFLQPGSSFLLRFLSYVKERSFYLTTILPGSPPDFLQTPFTFRESPEASIPFGGFFLAIVFVFLLRPFLSVSCS